MTYQDAFEDARRACTLSGETVYLVHFPQGTDEPEERAYDWGNERALTLLFPGARVLARFVPMTLKLDPAPAPPRA